MSESTGVTAEFNDKAVTLTPGQTPTLAEEQEFMKVSNGSRDAWGEKKKEKADRKGYRARVTALFLGTNLENEPFMDEKLPIQYIKSTLQAEVDTHDLQKELIVYIPFLIMFIFFSLGQMSIESASYATGAQQAMVKDHFFPAPKYDQQQLLAEIAVNDTFMYIPIDKTFDDISNSQDWNRWLRGVVDELWNCDNPLANESLSTLGATSLGGLSTPQRGQQYNLGGLQLRTFRVNNQSCAVDGNVVGDNTVADLSCYGSFSSDNTDTSSPMCNLTNPVNSSLPTMFQYVDTSTLGCINYITTERNVYPCGGYIVQIPFSYTCAQATSILSVLTNSSCPFVDDKATRLALLEYYTYSVNLDIFVSVKMISEVTSGGGWVMTSQIRPFLVWTVAQVNQTIFDFFFFAFVLYHLVYFCISVKQHYMETGSIFSYFLDIWTLVDAVNVVTYITVFILKWIWWGESRATRTQLPLATNYPLQLDTLLLMYSQIRYATAFNFILTFMKTIKFLKVSDRLNVISLTFQHSQSDVLGLLFLFVMIVTGYAVSATLLFGNVLSSFASVDRSFSSLLFMLLGVLDYDDMKAVNPLLAGTFFWSYLIITFFLILNFIVAVISEAFSKAGDEQFVLPLSESFQLLVKSTLRSLVPAVIIANIKLGLKGKGMFYLREQMLQYISQGYMIMMIKSPTSLDVLVTPREIIQMLPVHIRSECTFALSRDWPTMKEKHETMLDSDEEKKKKLQRTIVSDGMIAALGTVNADLAAYDEHYDKVDALCNKLVNLMGGSALDKTKKRLS